MSAPRFEAAGTPLQDLYVVRRRPIGDNRGFLERLFCSNELSGFIQKRQIRQINVTLTAKAGAVRGMHFQKPPYAEMKFVSCLRGEVFDVAVDLRAGSPTFLKWHAVRLKAGDHSTFLIPEGFAHGFQTLTENCELLYFHTAAYEPAAEGGLNARDPRLAIAWPSAITEVSERDSAHPMLSADFKGLTT